MWDLLVIIILGSLVGLGWLRDRNRGVRLGDNSYGDRLLWLAEATYHTIRICLLGLLLLAESIGGLGKYLLNSILGRNPVSPRTRL